ncbi:MAG: hypothetical protein ACFCGT_24935 [Sandaracinaceae bacterium]
MLVVGVDENGLGPQLGPLVTTAVVLELGSYRASRWARLGARHGIGDSKATSAFGRMAHAESIALALLEALHGRAPTDADELVHQVSLDGVRTLRAPCPRRSAPQCWGQTLPLPVFGGELAQGRRALAALRRGGVRVRRARSAVACVRVFNQELARRGSKLEVDLALFERLLLDARESGEGQLLAMCGMVGGIRRYGARFDRFRDLVQVVHEETRRRCAYRIRGVGDVVFEVDSDANHLPVGLASMLGKYVREIAMERQNRFYRSHQPDLEPASGYHDPVTRRFVEGTAPLRRRLRIADRCFVRAR